MALIRIMHESDIEAVRTIDAAAFGAWRSRLAEKPVELPPRTRANVLASMAKDPEGCFVAEDGGRVAGYIFSRTWGTTGWFGPFGVLPDVQGRGIGKQLIAASVAYLRRAGGEIGLETMPESAYNLGLYLRQGFQARCLSLILAKELGRASQRDASLLRWSEAGLDTRERWLTGLRRAMDYISPGFDCTKEIVIAGRMGLVETVLLTDGEEAIGSATLAFSGVREGANPGVSNLQTMILDPAHTHDDTFRALVDAAEALARAGAKHTLFVPVYAGHAWAVDRLLAWGYRVDRSLVRMIRAGTGPGPAADGFVELARWAA